MRYVLIIIFIGILGGAGFLVAGLNQSGPAGSAAAQATLPDFSQPSSVEVVEDCRFGRCPCMTSRIRQTSVPAGKVKVTRDQFSGSKCGSVPSGYYASKNRIESCVVCPSGWQYSGLLQDREGILSRGNLPGHQCVKIERTWLDTR